MKKMRQLWKKSGLALALSLLFCLLALPVTARATEAPPEEGLQIPQNLRGYKGDTLSTVDIEGATQGKIHWVDPDKTLEPLGKNNFDAYYEVEIIVNRADNGTGAEAVEQSEEDGRRFERIPVSVPVTVFELDSITITEEPVRTKYLLGESFQVTGMRVKAHYTDGAANEIYHKGDGFIITDGENLPWGKEYVTVSYTDHGVTKTTPQPISVSKGYTVKINGIVSGHYAQFPEYDKVNHTFTVNKLEGSSVSFLLEQPEGATYEGISIVKGLTKEQLRLQDSPEQFAGGQAGFLFTMPANDVEITIHWSGLNDKKQETPDNNGGGSSSGSSGSGSSTPTASAPQPITQGPKTADTNAVRTLGYPLLLLAAVTGVGGITLYRRKR